jgi:DNA-directed RNA polymerase beta' subunit
MMVGEELSKAVESIRFTLLSPSEIRKMSVVEVQTADTYDEDGGPHTVRPDGWEAWNVRAQTEM